jgi:hypothetical protein
MTEREAEVVRRLLEQLEYADTDNRTAGIGARVLRRIQLPTPQDPALARVWIVETEHKQVLGRQVSVFATQADAETHAKRMRARYPRMLAYCDIEEHPVEPATAPVKEHTP